MEPITKGQLERLRKEHYSVPNSILESLTKEQASDLIQEGIRVRNAINCSDVRDNPIERQRAMEQLSNRIKEKYGPRVCRFCGKGTDGANSETKCCC